jgi:hypothetical protein
VVEILLGALVERQIRNVLVIVILLQKQDAIFGERFGKPISDGRLTGASAATDADRECSRQEFASSFLVNYVRRFDRMHTQATAKSLAF